MQRQVSESVFAAIPALNRSDADFTLLFLVSHTAWSEAVSDPWFQSLVQLSNLNNNGVNLSYYQPIEPVSVLACVE